MAQKEIQVSNHALDPKLKAVQEGEKPIDLWAARDETHPSVQFITIEDNKKLMILKDTGNSNWPMVCYLDPADLGAERKVVSTEGDWGVRKCK